MFAPLTSPTSFPASGGGGATVLGSVSSLQNRLVSGEVTGLSEVDFNRSVNEMALFPVHSVVLKRSAHSKGTIEM